MGQLVPRGAVAGERETEIDRYAVLSDVGYLFSRNTEKEEKGWGKKYHIQGLCQCFT